MMSPYLFVYGTLRRDAGHPMHQVLASHAVWIGPSVVRGELYSLGRYPGLARVGESSDCVTGELYEIAIESFAETIEALDAYEGVDCPQRDGGLYRRQLGLVELADGRRLDAWMYVLNRSTDDLTRIASGDFGEWRTSRA